jgi:hypothetical protein
MHLRQCSAHAVLAILTRLARSTLFNSVIIILIQERCGKDSPCVRLGALLEHTSRCCVVHTQPYTRSSVATSAVVEALSSSALCGP